IIMPSLKGMEEMGTPFVGVLYAGLMITPDGPSVIEYNVRFGDPECQALMPRLKDDLLALMQGAVDGQLAHMSVRWRDEAALTVVLAADGYPAAPKKGSVIRGLEDAAAEGAEIFHAGTALRDGRLVADGGRVLNETALGHTVTEAREKAYRAVDRILWPEGFCRRDIGRRAIERESGGS